MRVYTVVGIQKGCIEDIAVFIREEDADKFKTKIDEEYGNKDGNDSGLFRCDAIITGKYRQLRWEVIKILQSHGYSYRDMEVIFGCNKDRIGEIKLKGITDPNAHNFPSRYLRYMRQDEVMFPTYSPKRRTRTQLQMDTRAVKRLRKRGLQINDLAKRFDVSRQTIRQWLKRERSKE